MRKESRAATSRTARPAASAPRDCNLLLTHAHLLRSARLVSVIAGAPEASECVDARSVVAEAGQHFAVVDVFAVGSETGSVGAKLHEVGCVGAREEVRR